MSDSIRPIETKSITVQVRNVYGNETIYPACKDAATFAQMLGQKSLTRADLNMIKALGYTIVVLQLAVAI